MARAEASRAAGDHSSPRVRARICKSPVKLCCASAAACMRALAGRKRARYTASADPPPVGSWVTYRYRGVHEGSGLPRFASFVRVRADEARFRSVR